VIAALALAAALVLDGGDVEQQQLREPTRYTLCATGDGRVAFCGTREPLCWDLRHHVLAACSHVAQEEGGSRGTPFRVSVLLAGNAFDLLSTGIARGRGAHEANPLLQGGAEPSTGVEIRVGLKGIGLAGEIVAVEVIARVFHRPKIANILAGGIAALNLAVGVHNLAVTR
jgi:hypothetical protein